METFHILHLAKSWSNSASGSVPSNENTDEAKAIESPVGHLPTPFVSTAHKRLPSPEEKYAEHSKIRAASVQMIFAARLSRDFITPETVRATEAWTGEAVLSALAQFRIPEDVRKLCNLAIFHAYKRLQRIHPNKGSVWSA